MLVLNQTLSDKELITNFLAKADELIERTPDLIQSRREKELGRQLYSYMLRLTHRMGGRGKFDPVDRLLSRLLLCHSRGWHEECDVLIQKALEIMEKRRQSASNGQELPLLSDAEADF